MTPTEAKEIYGATHYSVAKDKITPRMFYKKEPMLYNDDTCKLVWVYLNYNNFWVGSSITEEESKNLKEIKGKLHPVERFAANMWRNV